MLRCKTVSAKLLAKGGPVSSATASGMNPAVFGKTTSATKDESSAKEAVESVSGLATETTVASRVLQHSPVLCSLPFPGVLAAALSSRQQLCGGSSVDATTKANAQRLVIANQEMLRTSTIANRTKPT